MLSKVENTLDSREVAKMIGKEHKAIMRDIRRYTSQLNECNLAPVDFFKESKYFDGKGEMRPAYQITRKGCEFMAHKLTGTKGTEFTARYINRFHEMENIIIEKQSKPVGKQVVDVPVNERIQQQLAEIKKNVAGLEALIDMYSQYRTDEDHEKINYTLRQMECNLGSAVFKLTSIQPQLIYKVM